MWASTAWAADPPVVLDLTRTLVLSNAEVVAMGGAGAAFAAGGPGMVQSPAAPANRRLEAIAPVMASLVFLQAPIHDDRDLTNAGTTPFDRARMVDLGLAGGYRNVAGGLSATVAWHPVDDAWVAVLEGHAPVAVAFREGRVVAGLGPRVLGMRVDTAGEHVDYLGTGVEAGVLLARMPEEWNFALTLRSGVSAAPLGSAYADIAAVRLPPQLVAGVGWCNLSRLKEGQGGIPVRLAADVEVDAPVADAVGLERVFEADATPRGAAYTVSPRLGAEVDLWPDRFRLRAGTYLEPSRTSVVGPRPHATGGFELRLFRLHAFHQRLNLNLAWQAGVDYAPGYFRGAWLGINLWQGGLVGRPRQPPLGEQVP